ncbi:MAG: precorrin-6y C5,15-methyltransferase (decarboxylating) subunit CbiE [Clostridium sp.]|nr:precorrin-6y C5,15-methyltransferase (decarboxylating) subunit CbiE [Clostridium sp.]
MVYIVGIGPGSEEYITKKAEDILRKSDIIIGFKRGIESLYYIDNLKINVTSLSRIINILNEKKYENICIAASGDPCFYGITDFIKKNYIGEISVIPGISSFQYMMAKLSKPWQDGKLFSLHGKSENLIKKVTYNKLTIWLTDNINTPNSIGLSLLKNNIKADIYVGENLSYDDERIQKIAVENIINMEFSKLCVVVIERMD